MTDWLATMRVIRGIQSRFTVTVFEQSPQMIGFLDRNWSHANGNKCHTISVEDGRTASPKFEESTYCK